MKEERYTVAGTLVALATVLVLFLTGGTVEAEGEDQDLGYRSPWSRLTNNVQFGGYYDFEYEDKERADGEFDQHRTILFFGVQPHERVKMFAELEYEHGGEAGDLKFEQAWFEFALNERFNARAGVDLIPVGRLNFNHDSNQRDFIFRPEVDERLIPTTWYESGIWLNGDISDNLSLVVGLSNGLRESTSVGTKDEIRKMRRTTDLSKNDNNDNKALSGRLAFKPMLGLEVGVSGYTARYTSTGNGDSDVQFVAVDVHYIDGPFELKGEYVDVDKDSEQGGNANAITDADGGYVELAYHFFPQGWYDSWFAKGFDNPVFTALARYETLDFNTPANPIKEDKDIFSIGINYRPVEQVVFKLSYDFEDRDDPTVEDQDRFGAGVAIGF